MKKIALSILALAASFLGVGNAKAQIAVNFTTEPMAPEYATMAQQIVEKQTSDPDGANKIFSKLMGKVKKNKEQATAVGKFFLDNKIYPCANQCAKAAYAVDYSYEPGLLLGVGVHLLRRDYGQAGAKLDEIIANNPNNLEAKRLSARVYKYVNPYAAKGILEELIAMDPNYEDIQKQMGDVSYMLEDYKTAVASYGKYFAKTPNPDIMDLMSGENYLIALMNQGDFYTMKDIVTVLEPLIDERDIVVPRMKFIAQMETMDYAGASEGVKYVSENKFNDTIYVDYDYLYAATYFNEVEDYARALDFQKKRLELKDNKDKNIQLANKEIAALYRKLGTPVEGVPYYEKYIELLGEDADVADKLLLGNYYNAVKNSLATPEEKMAIIQKADPIFAEYMEKLPQKYQGPFFRAQLWMVNSSEPEAEPLKWYDKVIEIVDALPAEEQEAARVYKVTALQYHLWDCIGKNDVPNARIWMEKVLELDPENDMANKVKALIG